MVCACVCVCVCVCACRRAGEQIFLLFCCRFPFANRAKYCVHNSMNSGPYAYLSTHKHTCPHTTVVSTPVRRETTTTVGESARAHSQRHAHKNTQATASANQPLYIHSKLSKINQPLYIHSELPKSNQQMYNIYVKTIKAVIKYKR